MRRVVFDIETVGCDLDALDETSREYFLKFADTPQKVEEAKSSLNFYPLTAQIVAIAMLDVATGKGAVYFQENGGTEKTFQDNGVNFFPCEEKGLLQNFWDKMQHYDQFITFNGRLFDCPFLMLRSAMLHVRPSKHLIPYRYNHAIHIDLADQLSFYDALRRRFSLHMWCRAFGIASPKAGGMSGLDVKTFFEGGRGGDIARYCLGDVWATRELFFYWDKYLKF